MKFLITFICLSSTFLLTNAQFRLPFRPRTDCTTPSKSYCMNEKQFVLCDGAEGGDIPAVLSCPIDGEFCSHDAVSSCSTTTTNTNTQCDQCLTGATGHACLSMTSFKTCAAGEAGGAVVTGEEKFCNPGLYCDVFHPNRENPCRRYSGQQFLCWKEYKAPAPPTVADICAQKGQEGNHENEMDTDCTTFRACSKDETTGKWSGKILNCSPNYFFDPNLRACVPPVIYKCRKTTLAPTTTTTAAPAPPP